jgi:hypothetical protein
MMKNSCSLQLNTQSGTVASLSTMLKTSCVTLNQVTGHPGSKRFYGQLGQRYHHRDLHRMVDNLNCDLCRRNKLNGKGYGFLPEREVRSIPFEECTMDLIRPWKVQVHGKPHKFEAFDVPVQDPKSRSQVKNPSQDPKPRFKTKNISHNCCLFVVCLLLSQIPGWRMTPRSVTSEMCAL